MPYPSFLRAARVPGAVAAAPAVDVQQINVYRALTSMFEEWEALLTAAQTAVDAAPPGAGKTAAEAHLDNVAGGLLRFKTEAYLRAELAAAYAAIA